ncbi:MAG: cob(I)yrinic acid a,c-diamide adenosyltransferase [Rhodocyclaceae bacterium]
MDPAHDDTGLNDRHRARMARKKAVVDGKIAAATAERGILIVLTGNGKGKSSSAFGMVARALGHDMRVGIVQFIKGASPTGEERFFARQPNVDYTVAGEGFTWNTQDRDRDIERAGEGWRKAGQLLADPDVGLIVLDELCIVLKHRYLELDPVLAALRARPPMQHVVITGRGAPSGLIDMADTVSEIADVKHAFRAGLRAQKGTEW